MWNISKRLTVPSAILHWLNPPLNKLNTGHKEHTTKSKVSDLLYMDDLKLIGKTEDELQKQVQIVRTFTYDIHKKFGLDKCAKTVLKRGKLVHSQNLILDFNRELKELKQGKTHKYLGTEESKGIQPQQTKERMRKEYTKRLTMILKSKLNAKNKFTAIEAKNGQIWNKLPPLVRHYRKHNIGEPGLTVYSENI